MKLLLKISKSKDTIATGKSNYKNAVSRITGGAGGFGAFDAGRNIVDQIELTGEVDVVEATKLCKGCCNWRNGRCSWCGWFLCWWKPAEFVSEVFGLGTVGPFIGG
ncbi:MAG: hypothetical protein CM15mV56_260 [uncultured marine virus]|nr:MAG: hypothetical protein CM15mV56_260 [uncultured marine virus]